MIGIPGGFAKQSFVLFSTLFATTWWITLRREDRNYHQALWVGGLAGTSYAALEIAHYIVAGNTITPSRMLAWWGCDNCLVAILDEFTNREFWYAFIWLLPLGVWRLNRLPKPWIVSVLVTALLTITLGGYARMYGDVCRPLFTIVGPAFSLSVAFLLTGSDAYEKRIHVFQSSV
jgi:hypothetical protein